MVLPLLSLLPGVGLLDLAPFSGPNNIFLSKFKVLWIQKDKAHKIGNNYQKMCNKPN